MRYLAPKHSPISPDLRLVLWERIVALEEEQYSEQQRLEVGLRNLTSGKRSVHLQRLTMEKPLTFDGKLPYSHLDECLVAFLMLHILCL